MAARSGTQPAAQGTAASDISASFATPADLAKESYPVGKGGKVAGEPSESTLMTGGGWTGAIRQPARG